MPPITSILEKLLPEASAFLERTMPLVQERVAPVMQAAAEHFAKQPEVLQQVRNAALPAAAHFRSLRTGDSIYASSADVLSQLLSDTDAMARGVHGAAADAAAGHVPSWQKSFLTADMTPLTGQYKINDLMDMKKRYSLPDNPRDAHMRAAIDAKLNTLVSAAKGQMAVKDMPSWVYWSPLGPVSKSDIVFGMRSRIPTDAAAATTAIDANMKGIRSAFATVMKGFTNIGSKRQFRNDMRRAFEEQLPLTRRYYDMREQIEEWNRQISHARGTALTQLTAQRDALAQRTVDVYGEVQRMRHAAFSPYFNEPDVRIALYSEPDSRAWVEHLMQPKEIEAANWYSQLMENARTRGEQLGMPMLEQGQQYVTHLLHYVSEGGHRSAEAQAFIDRMAPSMIRFAHRATGSLMPYPSIRTIGDAYITSASRKFGIRELMNKYGPILEQMKKHNPTSFKYWEKYFKQYTDAVMDEKNFDKLFRGSLWWMYFSKTANSLSVGRKHVEKAVSLFSTYPLDATMSIPPAARAGLQLAFQRAGAVPGSYARLTRNFLSTRTFGEAISGLGALENQRLRTLVNTLAAFPVNAVEMTERGIGTIAALRKATRKGLSADDTAAAMWSVLTDHSFMGKADRPLWMGRPWQQLLALFAYTPFRITETSIKRIVMALPRRHVQELQNDVIQTALKFPRDIFGTPQVKNTLMFIAGVGATEELARHFLDASVWKEMAFHLSLLRDKGGETALYFWPFDVAKEGEKRGGSVNHPMPFLTALADSMLAFPQWQRYLRAEHHQIPPVYAGSRAREIFALPSVTAEKQQGQRFAPQVQRRQQKAVEGARQRREQQWPIGPILRALPPHVREYIYKHTGL